MMTTPYKRVTCLYLTRWSCHDRNNSSRCLTAINLVLFFVLFFIIETRGVNRAAGMKGMCFGLPLSQTNVCLWYYICVCVYLWVYIVVGAIQAIISFSYPSLTAIWNLSINIGETNLNMYVCSFALILSCLVCFVDLSIILCTLYNEIKCKNNIFCK